ncbi:hypothetical protein ABIE78_003643 [Sinorhizobium fredii]
MRLRPLNQRALFIVTAAVDARQQLLECDIGEEFFGPSQRAPLVLAASRASASAPRPLSRILSLMAALAAGERRGRQHKDVQVTFRLPKSFSRILKTQKKFRRLVESSLLRLPEKVGPQQKRRPSAPKPILTDVTGFGSNPGRLGMKLFVPRRLPAKPALVVILHGCGQTPESLDIASGFSKLAAQRVFSSSIRSSGRRTTRNGASTGFVQARSPATAARSCRSGK